MSNAFVTESQAARLCAAIRSAFGEAILAGTVDANLYHLDERDLVGGHARFRACVDGRRPKRTVATVIIDMWRDFSTEQGEHAPLVWETDVHIDGTVLDVGKTIQNGETLHALGLALAAFESEMVEMTTKVTCSDCGDSMPAGDVYTDGRPPLCEQCEAHLDSQRGTVVANCAADGHDLGVALGMVRS